MTIKDIVEVLQSVKRREIKDNQNINTLCTNPSGSVGAKAIDEAIVVLSMLESCGLTPERVAELAKAESEGRLVVLPCKVNDYVYFKLNGKITEQRIMYVTIYNTNRRFELGDGLWFTDDAIGYEVFLTREAAETVLKEGTKE